MLTSTAPKAVITWLNGTAPAFFTRTRRRHAWRGSLLDSSRGLPGTRLSSSSQVERNDDVAVVGTGAPVALKDPMPLSPHHDLLLRRFAAGPVRIDRHLPEIDVLEQAGFIVRIIGPTEGEFIYISEAGTERLRRLQTKFAKRFGTFSDLGAARGTPVAK